jgi:hypothetical protein
MGYDSTASLYKGYAFNPKIINYSMTADSFMISHFINLGEYKKYLADIKRDSANEFFLLQLPDSSITSSENYTKYITDDKYNSSPVVGIRWDAAMNYCKWLTLKENKSTGIQYVYRLPKVSEWLLAKKYLNEAAIQNDLNKNYSDWTVCLYYEGAYSFGNFSYDVIYYPKKTDPARGRRSRVIGNSFLFQHETLKEFSGSFYQFNGYRQIAFRIVREYIKDAGQIKSNSSNLLKYWNIAQ